MSWFSQNICCDEGSAIDFGVDMGSSAVSTFGDLIGYVWHKGYVDPMHPDDPRYNPASSEYWKAGGHTSLPEHLQYGPEQVRTHGYWRPGMADMRKPPSGLRPMNMYQNYLENIIPFGPGSQGGG